MTLLNTTVETRQPSTPSTAQECVDQETRDFIVSAISDLQEDLYKVNHELHSHPETAYEEVFAHATITDFLEAQGFQVQRHAYGLETAFSAEAGSSGRLVIICAEYDALPGIGHGCGHNLIATSSLGAFLGATRYLNSRGVAGRVRIVGTPAEEGGGGKIKLLQAGAFSEDVSAAIMCHALPLEQFKKGWTGTAGFRSKASQRLLVEFRGKAAHAGAQPWSGVNALDAAVATYTQVSMLRQQIRPHERLQGVIEDGGEVPNIIPEYSRMAWGMRAASLSELETLRQRVVNCIEGAAQATGCTVNIEWHATETPDLSLMTQLTQDHSAEPYKELRVNETLCNEYIKAMSTLGEKILFEDDAPSAAGTDMGNVSYAVPGFHGMFGIPTPKDVPVHHRDFATAAGTKEAHNAAIKSAQGMAMLVVKVLTDVGTAARVKEDHIRDQNSLSSSS